MNISTIFIVTRVSDHYTLQKTTGDKQESLHDEFSTSLEDVDIVVLRICELVTSDGLF